MKQLKTEQLEPLIFEQADDYNKPIIFGKTTISNMKKTVIKIKTYQE